MKSFLTLMGIAVAMFIVSSCATTKKGSANYPSYYAKPAHTHEGSTKCPNV